VFTTGDGPASLRDLFRGHSQLIVHHFMFDPSWSQGCPSCSSVADGYNGFRVHLENHDVTLTAVSRASIGVLTAYQQRMGWDFPWASSAGRDFNFGSDGLWGMYQWLDRAPLGRNESGSWFRRHDEYDA
jgi:predicted dithiol-disulfide oxidoreductase (DUF899 family)